MTTQPTTRIHVRVTPRAGKDEIVARDGDDLLVRVTAAPDGGKANDAVCKLVAKSIGVPKSAVGVARGQTARHKALEVIGIDDAQAAAWLEGFPKR